MEQGGNLRRLNTWRRFWRDALGRAVNDLRDVDRRCTETRNHDHELNELHGALLRDLEQEFKHRQARVIAGDESAVPASDMGPYTGA